MAILTKKIKNINTGSNLSQLCRSSTDIDLFKILDLRESHMSFFFDNKEVA